MATNMAAKPLGRPILRLSFSLGGAAGRGQATVDNYAGNLRRLLRGR
jgi:hypothetical protein